MDPDTVPGVGGASSYLLGVAALAIVALLALLLTASRAAVAAERVFRVRCVASVGVVLQAAHFAEEYLADFHLRYPSLLGLAPWSAWVFVAFNLAWLAVWILSIALLTTYPRAACFPLWFLGIASAANGIAHPLFAVVMRGYFPGLWSAALVGLCGIALIVTLGGATRRGPAPS